MKNIKFPNFLEDIGQIVTAALIVTMGVSALSVAVSFAITGIQ